MNGTGVSHVVIQNLNMYFSRSTAIEMHDGELHSLLTVLNTEVQIYCNWKLIY